MLVFVEDDQDKEIRYEYHCIFKKITDLLKSKI